MQTGKNIFIVLLLGLWIITEAFGQSAYSPQPNTTIKEEAFPYKVKIPGNKYFPARGIEGSPYFLDEFVNGTIYFTNGLVAENAKLKYDGLQDKLIATVQNNQQHIQVDKEFVASFIIHYNNSSETENYNFKRLSPAITGLQKDVYAQILFQDSVALFIHRKVEIKGGKEERVVNNKKVAVHVLKNRPAYFLKLPDHKMITLKKISRRRILKAMPEQYTSEAKELLKREKIKVRKEEGLIEAVVLLDQLFQTTP